MRPRDVGRRLVRWLRGADERERLRRQERALEDMRCRIQALQREAGLIRRRDDSL